MPSFSHEGIVRLFCNRPELAVELLRDVLGVPVPAYAEVRIESADLTDVEPAARYADLVVLLADGKPVLGIVVEVQLDVDPDKVFAWPAYLANLRARLRCAVELLVYTPSRRVARWADRPIAIGRGTIRPLVVGPEGIPRITTAEEARRDPELAVLGAIAHAQDPVEEAVPVALAALAAVSVYDDARAALYSDLLMTALGDATRAALEDLMRSDKYEYQWEFARHHQAVGRAEGRAEGKAEGKAEGRAEDLLVVLETRGLSVTADQRERIRTTRDLAELERWLRRAVTATRTDEVFE